MFLGLPFHNEVKKFLDTHTNHSSTLPSSTFRDSRNTPFNWTRQLSYDEVDAIQQNCSNAMQLWSYKKANSSQELLNDFNPISPFSEIS
jgi:hypothetical protein